MERLTEWTAVGILVKEDYGEKVLRTLYSCYGGKPNPHYTNCEEGYCAMEKLAAYEDAEEQGLLLRLPCKVGDTVYKINKASKKISKHKVLKIETEMMETFFATKIWFENYDFTFAHRFGEVIFFTREEAEAKLKGVEEKESKDASAWKNHIMNRFMREE